MISLATRAAGYSTRPGFVNSRGQVVIRNTGLPGTDHGQTVYQLGCSQCGHVYGANGADIHHRRCPLHDHGAPGLAYGSGIFADSRNAARAAVVLTRAAYQSRRDRV